MANDLGTYLRERRTALGLTQEHVATATGIGRSHLSQIESGKIGFPSAETRRQLAAILAVDHLDLLVAAGELTSAEAVAKCSELPTDLERTIGRLPPEARDALLTLVQTLLQDRSPHSNGSDDTRDRGKRPGIRGAPGS